MIIFLMIITDLLFYTCSYGIIITALVFNSIYSYWKNDDYRNNHDYCFTNNSITPII